MGFNDLLKMTWKTHSINTAETKCVNGFVLDFYTIKKNFGDYSGIPTRPPSKDKQKKGQQKHPLEGNAPEKNIITCYNKSM